ncbi:MAG: hypothetical protein AAF250_01215 [Pseudomonadota bacterium]
MKRLSAMLIGMTALTQAQVAQAQEACVAPADLNDTVIYAMPLAYDAAQTACDSEFLPDGFISTDGEAFIDGFRLKQDDAWPGAFRLLKVFMNTKGSDTTAPEIGGLISSLPEESLRPFIDGIITQMIIPKIKPDTCGKIEEALELLAPLPVENVSGLVTFIAEQTDVKNPKLCATTNSRSAN